MRLPRSITRLAVGGSLALAALAAPAAAGAAPTGSQITSPGDPSHVTYVAESPAALHIAGTTSGGAGDVDLRCYYGSTSKPIVAGVPVVNGAFALDLPVSQALWLSISPRPYCVLRAVPAGTIPAAPPDQASPFEGPQVGWGGNRAFRLGAAGAPNPADTLFDFGLDRAQKRAYSDYYSAGSCGLCDTILLDPVTLAPSHKIWWGNAALFRALDLGPQTRSAVRVDGVDVYNPSAAGAGGTLRNNPGFPRLFYSSTVDPVTGDLTVVETDPFSPCDSQAPAFPPTDLNCPSFGVPVVMLKRTIVQDHDGLQVTIVDRWRSNDEQPHELDAYYDENNYSTDAAIAGHHSLYDFSWTGAGFTTYPDDTAVPAPADAPATMFLKSDATTPDSGDGSNPIGALTYGTAPTEMIVRHSANATSHTGVFQARYKRTIPAAGELVIAQVYSHDFSLPSVRALAQEAEQRLGQAPADPATGPVTADPGTATPAPATQPGAPATCKVPKLRGRTLHRAKRLLARAHCRLGKVTRRATTRVRPRRVLTSKPRPGSVRAPGFRVALRLAKAPAA